MRDTEAWGIKMSRESYRDGIKVSAKIATPWMRCSLYLNENDELLQNLVLEISVYK